MQDLLYLLFSEQFSQKTKKKHPKQNTNAAAAVWKAKNVPVKLTANADITKIRTLKPDATARKTLKPDATAKTQKPVTAVAKTARIANAKITKKR